jgi:hypothetical protein
MIGLDRHLLRGRAAVNPEVTYDAEVHVTGDVWRTTSFTGWDNEDDLREALTQVGYYSSRRARIVKVSRVVVHDDDWRIDDEPEGQHTDSIPDL